MSEPALRYEPSVPMHQDHRGGWVKLRDYERLRAELAEKDKRIEELEEALSKSIMHQKELDRCVHITAEQIDKAWGSACVGGPVYPLAAMNHLNIVACEECGGSGIPTPYEVGSGESCHSCHGHGWVIK